MDTNKLILLDTETTGKEEHDRLIQVAYKVYGEKDIHCEVFKPNKKISVEAQAVHHITNEMVGEKGPFVGSLMWETLRHLFHDEKAVLVAHNAEFDKKMMEKEGFVFERFICTKKCSQHLDTEGVIKSYSLQHLRYLLKFEVNGGAHTADDDVATLEVLYERIAKKMTVDEMVKVSKEPMLLKRIPFGKHKGTWFKDVSRDYLLWLKGRENLEGDLLYTVEHYLAENI